MRSCSRHHGIMSNAEPLIESPRKPLIPPPDDGPAAGLRELPGAIKQMAKSIDNLADANQALEFGMQLGFIMGLLVGLIVGVVIARSRAKP